MTSYAVVPYGNQCYEVQDTAAPTISAVRVAMTYGPDALSTARLITAAPDMLQALYVVRGQISGYAELHLAVRFIDAAISKATQEATP